MFVTDVTCLVPCLFPVLASLVCSQVLSVINLYIDLFFPQFFQCIIHHITTKLDIYRIEFPKCIFLIV